MLDKSGGELFNACALASEASLSCTSLAHLHFQRGQIKFRKVCSFLFLSSLINAEPPTLCFLDERSTKRLT